MGNELPILIWNDFCQTGFWGFAYIFFEKPGGRRLRRCISLIFVD